MRSHDVTITDRQALIALHIGVALVSMFFALVLWSADWSTIRGSQFADLNNYIEGFYYGRYQYDQSASLIEWYTQEYLWRGLVYQLGNFFDYEGVFSAIAFVTIAVSSIFVAQKSRSVVYLLLIASPLTIDLAFSQSRSAFGMTIIWLALLTSRTPIRVALLILAPMIHSAMLIYSVSLLIPWNREFISRHAALITVAFIVISAAILGPLRSGVLEVLGDRRAYIDIEGSGALFTVMLASYGLPFAFARRLILQDRIAMIAVLSAVLSLSVNLSGGTGNRFVALALPAIAVGYSRIPNRTVRAFAYTGLLASSAVYFFVFWAN